MVISMTATGGAIEVPEKWAVATLGRRTNVVDKRGVFRAHHVMVGRRRLGKATTASTASSTSTRK
eukprot:scaffold14606_cov257-Amphora_coffeaeformis.AAC.1